MNQVSEPPLFGISLRQPPSNVQAEQALLGAILTNNRALDAVVEFLKPEHFAEPLHGRVYQACAKRVLAGGVADPMTLMTWFNADPDADSFGGQQYLSELMMACVSPRMGKEYGLAIYECWQRRELIGLGQDVVDTGFTGDDASTAIGRFHDRLDGIVAGTGAERKGSTFDEALDAAIASAERAQHGGGPVGVSTGMPSVDEVIGGLEPQTMTVVAARPGMGKTALGVAWGVDAARAFKAAHGRGEPRQGVLIVSLEMSAEQLARRVLSAAAGVHAEAIRHGRLQQSDWDRLIRARAELAGLPLVIEDWSSLSIGMIRLKARMHRRRFGKLGLILVDHLHIVKPEDGDTKNGATWAVGKVSNGLKALAKEFECPMLALAQLNRSVESRDDKRPTLADLRQAGEIEQDADAVAFIYRGEYYLPKGEPERGSHEAPDKYAERCFLLQEQRVRLKGKAELIFEKVREGRPQVVPLAWHDTTTSFSEPAQ